MSSVREVCSCGATFDYSSRSDIADVECRIAVREWRKMHRHEPPQCPQEAREGGSNDHDATDMPTDTSEVAKARLWAAQHE
jgi:hypothetical protein